MNVPIEYLMTSHDTDDEEAEKLILHLLHAAGAEGVTHADIEAAYDQWVSLRVRHGLVQMVLDGKATLGWDGSELCFMPVEAP